MEDRAGTLLHLELGDARPEAAEERARTLAGSPGVQRVTWWANEWVGRTDLPMKVRDGRSLVVVEAAEDYEVVAPPSGTSESHCFRRHPRPSQGILTGGPTLGLMIVWISPRTPDLAQSLRDWGDFVHIRHIAAAAIPGFTQISVYENTVEGDPRFMHFYEFDNMEAEKTFASMVRHVAPRLGGMDSPAYAEWADWRPPGGRLFYCNSFTRLGEVVGGSAPPSSDPAAPST
jgi:hypothetical protein